MSTTATKYDPFSFDIPEAKASPRPRQLPDSIFDRPHHRALRKDHIDPTATVAESTPTMTTRESGISKRDTRRKDNGTREGFSARFDPAPGNKWICQIVEMDGGQYEAECDRPSTALNSAISKYREATGRTRLGRVFS